MNPEQHKEMCTLVAKELELNGISFEKGSWLASGAIMEEIVHLLIAESHESKTSSRGVIFAENFNNLMKTRKLSMPIGQLDLARRLANGIHSFLLYEKGNFSGLIFFSEPPDSELKLIRILAACGGLIAQRNANGVSKFFQQDSITIHDNRTWFTKPHVREAARRISQCVSEINSSVLNHVLEFAFHLLSPAARTGATLVWYLQAPSKQELTKLLPDQDLSPVKLSILDEGDMAVVCHLLSQVDGATIIDPSGRLIRAGVHLKYSAKSSELISEFRGTRHTSAQRFSYDQSKTLVITVSEDGPVTVFSDGASIANLLVHSSKQDVKLLKSAAPEKTQDITNRTFEMTCKRCDRLSLLEEIRVTGCNEQQAVHCPTCVAPLYSSLCFALECRPFKRIQGGFAPDAGQIAPPIRRIRPVKS